MPCMDPGFKKADPAGQQFQYLEDLATGYWYAESLFAAVELQLFQHIERHAMQKQGIDTIGLARAAGCREIPLARLMQALAQMALVSHYNGCWYNNPLARKYLLPDQPDYMGDFLLYRRYMQPRWNGLAELVAEDNTRLPRLSLDDTYEVRNFHYVRAVDRLARLKSREIAAVLAGLDWHGPVLDTGGGAGALSRCLLDERPDATAMLLDLPEVLAAARRLYPQAGHWRGLWPVAWDFRFAPPFKPEQKFGLVLMSNFLHAYGPGLAKQLLNRAADLMQSDGLLLIHDYFPDVPCGTSSRGALHDVNMMLNTAEGVCHASGTVRTWLMDLGLEFHEVIPLPSDSAVILACRQAFSLPAGSRHNAMVQKAIEIGFQKAVPLDPAQIETAPWVQVKCRFGCALHGQSQQCPPHTDTAVRTGQLLKSYSCGLLLVDQPPGRQFHERLLELEKTAFLNGYHKALAFGAGPCTLCETCDTDGPCRFPERARPSMEASGMDVYAIARRCGLDLAPVTARDGYVTYVGLLLLE